MFKEPKFDNYDTIEAYSEACHKYDEYLDTKFEEERLSKLSVSTLNPFKLKETHETHLSNMLDDIIYPSVYIQADRDSRTYH